MNTLAEKKNECCASKTRATYLPEFDIVETADQFVLYGDLPGVTSENLELQYEEGELRLKGNVGDCSEERKSLYREYPVGDYSRTFQLNDSVNGEKISAELVDGVLTVHLPKRDAVKPKRIDVKVG